VRSAVGRGSVAGSGWRRSDHLQVQLKKKKSAWRDELPDERRHRWVRARAHEYHHDTQDFRVSLGLHLTSAGPSSGAHGQTAPVRKPSPLRRKGCVSTRHSVLVHERASSAEAKSDCSVEPQRSVSSSSCGPSSELAMWLRRLILFQGVTAKCRRMTPWSEFAPRNQSRIKGS
jgi:hypothetical protein